MKYFADTKRFLLVAVLIAVLFATGCGVSPLSPPPGEIYTLYTGTTLYWVGQALQQRAGTWILSNGNIFLFLWDMNGQGVGFTMMNNTGEALHPVAEWVQATNGKGVLANYPDAQGMIKFLREQGWKTVAAEQVPVQIRNTMLLLGKQAALAAQYFITILVLPVGVDPWSLPAPYAPSGPPA